MNIPDLRTPRGIAIAVCAVVAATVLAAFAIPPGSPGRDVGTDGSGGLSSGILVPESEDLSAFVGSARWGVSLDEILKAAAAENRTRGGLNPVLRRMGFLGLIESGDAIAVLLASPAPDGGGIIELAPGDTLPDGRVLTAVTDNSITLSSHSEGAGDTGALEEVLLLFPRGEPESATTGRDS